VPAGPLRGTLAALAGRARAHPSSHGSAARNHGHPGPGEGILGIVGGVTLGPLAVAAHAPANAAAAGATSAAAAASGAHAGARGTSTSMASNWGSAYGRMSQPGFGGALQTTITVLAILNVQARGSRTGTVSSFRSRRHRR
jgi:hypothetical protein